MVDGQPIFRAMRHRSPDVLVSRRGLIAGAAGLLVARASAAALVATPTQTMGPFYPKLKPLDSDADLSLLKDADAPARGEVIDVRGRVLSVKGQALPGAVVELWQADAGGRYNHPRDSASGQARDDNFQGYGAVRTGPDGAFRFRTIRPRHYDTGAGLRTPHLHFRIVTADARVLATQMYFPGEALNGRDFIYGGLGSDILRAAATARLEPASPPRFLFDLVLA